MTETELLFTHTLDCSRLVLYSERGRIIDKEKAEFIASALKRRARGEPLQYILGKTEFMGLEFKVSPEVLIPRPETEILVETALKYVSRCQGVKVSGVNILDIGTGSGCIAVSLAKFLSNAKITAVDISQAAIEVAQYNANLNNVIDKINFMQGDLFPTSDLTPLTYNLIVANPPYIPAGQIDQLQPEIKYEPRTALDGGMDGLDILRRIVRAAPGHLVCAGLLIMEIGFGQAAGIKNILQTQRNFEIIEEVKDYCGIDRVMVARKNG